MRIDIQRADLVRALTTVSRAIETRNMIPVLSCVLLTAEPGRLMVRGTDLDVEISTSVPATCLPGAVCIDAKRLTDAARKLAGDVVLLEASDEGDKVTMRSGRTRFTFPTLPADDLPSLSADAFATTFEADLGALFAPVEFAISTEETRYYLNGILIEHTDAKLRAVATDGHRLAIHDVEAPVGADAMPSVIVPRKTVGLLPRGVAKVSVSTGKIRIESGDAVLVSKLIDGTYPDYRRVVPTENDKTLRVSRQALAAAVDRVSTITERGRAIRVSMAADSVTLDAADASTGSATEEVAAQYGSEPMTIGFNAKYVLDVLGVLTTDEVEIAMREPGTPALFRGQPEFDSVLMPMRV